MLAEIIVFILSSFVLIKSTQFAVRSVSMLSHTFKINEFLTSFLLVAGVSALPETFISIWSAMQGAPAIGAGTLLGSNIADLTLILGLVVLAGHPLRVHSGIIKKDLYFAALAILPVLLGIDGMVSRFDGIILLIAGIAFIITLLREKRYFHHQLEKKNHWLFHGLILLMSLTAMLGASHFIVNSAQLLAVDFAVPPLIIGLILVALGTTLPEFTFSLQSVRQGHPEAALGDLLGVVVVDACVVMGILALISPIVVEFAIWSVILAFTTMGSVAALMFMRSGETLTKNEAVILVMIYVLFVAIQVVAF